MQKIYFIPGFVPFLSANRVNSSFLIIIFSQEKQHRVIIALNTA